MPNISHSKKGILLMVGGITLALFLVFGFLMLSKSDYAATKNKVIMKIQATMLQDVLYAFLNSYSSIKKIVDISYFPYWFKDGNLETFSLEIDPADIERMNSILPDNKLDALLEENRPFVPAIFTTDSYSAEVEIRYRGYGKDHWNHGKRSFVIKFPRDNLFRNSVKSLDLIIPRDRRYIVEVSTTARLQDAGLKARSISLARATINGKDAGVYLAQDRFSKEWLEANKYAQNSEVFESSHTSDRIWRRAIEEESDDFEALSALKMLVENAEDEEFKSSIGIIVDMEKWYKGIAVRVINGSSHGFSSGNFNLFFNGATGRLEPLPEDLSMSSWEENTEELKHIYESFDSLTKRILSLPKFYHDYLDTLNDLVSEENFKKALAFYDDLYEESRDDFYSDRTKLHRNNTFDSIVRKYRDLLIRNYKTAREIADIQEVPVFEKGYTEEGWMFALLDSFDPGNDSSFRYIKDGGYSIETFLDDNPQFMKENDGIFLPRGVYVFGKNIVIPKDTHLTIEQGATLYFSPKKSLISYSPIKAIGKVGSPIRIAREISSENWGGIAIVNAGEESIFENVIFIGGSSPEKINGVEFTGMLAGHNAPLVVRNSEFHQDSDDDMINVKYGQAEIYDSKFFNSFADAIDLDVSSGFVVSGNTFSNIGGGEIGGDAIDVSFSGGVIKNNTVLGCEDKGVSVGEKSTVEILSNKFNECDIGIAVKDLSFATITNNKFTKNNNAISLYRKKEIFGGGEAEIYDNQFVGNNKEISADEYSTYYE